MIIGLWEGSGGRRGDDGPGRPGENALAVRGIYTAASALGRWNSSLQRAAATNFRCVVRSLSRVKAKRNAAFKNGAKVCEKEIIDRKPARAETNFIPNCRYKIMSCIEEHGHLQEIAGTLIREDRWCRAD